MTLLLKFHSGATAKFHDSALFELHEVVGGPSGGQSTQKGVSIFLQDRSLGDRPKIITSSKSESKLVIRTTSKSMSKILIPLRFASESLIVPVRKGVSLSKIIITEKMRSESNILIKSKSESHASFGFYTLIGRHGQRLDEKIKSFDKLKKLVKLSHLFHTFEAVDDIYDYKRLGEEIIISLNASEVQRGALLGVIASFPIKVEQIWMRILETKAMTVVQKAGLMETNKSTAIAYIGTKDLPAGDYEIQFSPSRHFTQMNRAQFKVKGGFSPLLALLPSIPGLGIVPDAEPKVIVDRPFSMLRFRMMMDSKVDPKCKELEGNLYDVDDPNMPQIPIHPNCRCWYQPQR